ncbi:MAG: hypothetical protein HY608_02900 [Planctomycetes bacterium]|nr:hypothetical protein [Planctomycetota bacterium]
MPPEPPDLSCTICGFEMVPRNCKIVCGNCGFRIDCGEIGIFPQEAPRRTPDASRRTDA